MEITRKRSIVLRVWPDRMRSGKRGFYFDVFIYPTKEQWVRACRRFASARSLQSVGGARVFLSARRTGKRAGMAYFYHSQFFDGCVAHECVHMALEICRIKGLDPLKSVREEECLARWTGDTHLQIFNTLRGMEGRKNESL